MPKTTLVALVGIHLIIGMALSGCDFAGLMAMVQAQLILLSWFLIGAIIFVASLIAIRRYPRPYKVFARKLRMDRGRVIEGSALFMLVAITIQAYMLIKVAIPSLVPFYADPYLARIDHAIFGTDPWRITHAIISPALTPWLDKFYLVPCLLVWIATTFWVCFSKDAAFRRRGVLTIALMWFLGGDWVALLLSSAGPAYVQHFYGMDRFVPLAHALSPELMAVQAQHFLLAHLGHPSPGMGISATPSMHNATYLLMVTFIYNRYGVSWKLAAAILFEAVVFISSVHLGWHYASDTILSIILIIPIWRLAGYLTNVDRRSVNGNTLLRPAKSIGLQPQARLASEQVL